MESTKAPLGKTSAELAPETQLSLFTRWHRSSLFNAIFVGLISFTQPGIWIALNLGAGGQETYYIVNATNSMSFGLMIPGCLLFSVMCNK